MLKELFCLESNDVLFRCGKVTGEGNSLARENETMISKDVWEYRWSDLVLPQKQQTKNNLCVR
jgi:hypothetical protein